MMYYLHSVPGRLRVKFPLLKGSRRGACRVQELLGGIPGIRNTAVSPVTGSLVIHYDPALVSPRDITRLLTREGYFEATRAVSNDEYIRAVASKALFLLAAFI